MEQFKFKSSVGMENYKFILENEDNLVTSLERGDDLEAQANQWFSELNRIFSRSFKIIRIRDKPKETETSRLFKVRSDLIQLSKRDKTNDKLKEDIEKVEAEIAEIVGKINSEKIRETFSKLDQSDGCNFSQGIWSLKNKTFPKNSSASVPAAKKDVTNTAYENKPRLNMYFDHPYLGAEMSFYINFSNQNNLQGILYLLGT